MKIYKISQNIEYLGKIGVPSENQQDILNHLMELDKETRKVVLRKIRQNPSISLREVRDLETDTKKDYMRGKGYDEKTIDSATAISPKYSVWLAREMKKYQEEEVKNYQKLVKFWDDIVTKYNVSQSSKYDALSKMSPEEKHHEKELNSKINIDPSTTYFKSSGPWNDTRLNQKSKPISQIIDYIEQNDPDIMSMSYSDALQASNEWHEELAQKAEEAKVDDYVSHQVVYSLPNGWEIVSLKAGDCEAEGELMGHCVGGYSKDVEQGRTQIFSLRDAKNRPHATIEMSIYDSSKYKPVIDGKPKKEEWRVEVIQIQGKSNEEPIDEYKEMIKQWFNNMKSEGYKFDPMDSDEWDNDEHSGIKDIEGWMDSSNDYGLPVTINGVGGDSETYYDNLVEAYNEGWVGAWWHRGISTKLVDDIVNYAIQNGELDKLESSMEGFESKVKINGKSVDGIKSMDDWADNMWFENELYLNTETPKPDEDEYPNREDYMILPYTTPNQIEFEGMPQAQPILNEEAYKEAIKEFEEKEDAYNKEIEEIQSSFEPFEFTSYIYNSIKEAKQRVNNEEGSIEEEAPVVTSYNKMKTKIYKIAKKETLSAEESAEYVKALQLYAKEHPSISRKYKDLINELPSARKIRQDFSIEECKILYETIDYLWKKLTGEHIIQEEEIIKAPETLFGNYWLLKNGILLKGMNHYSIVKNNTQLFCTLLNINGMTLQEYLTNDPQKLIGFILKNGGVRLFVNKDKKLYAQMSSSIYGKWGKAKIKKFDFPFKAVKVIDFKRPYNGWKSGITIKL